MQAQLPSNTVARLPTPSPPPSPPAAVSSRVYDLPTGFEDQPKLDVREASIQPLPAKPPIPMDSGTLNYIPTPTCMFLLGHFIQLACVPTIEFKIC